MNIALFLEQSKQLPKPATKPRARLAVLDAVKIFKLRGSEIQATSVANIYGVSEKADPRHMDCPHLGERNMASGAIARHGAQAGRAS